MQINIVEGYAVYSIKDNSEETKSTDIVSVSTANIGGEPL